MKKTLAMMAAAMCCITGFAQLKVYQNGNVGIGSTLTTTSSRLNIGDRSYDSSYNVTLLSSNGAGGSYNIGMEGWTCTEYAQMTGRAIGVRGVGGNCSAGYNYGVLGCLRGSAYGAGVFGTVGSMLGAKTDGKYAGYFQGDVKATGVTKASLVNPNDFSSNSTGSDITSPLSIINGLRPKLYSFLVTLTSDSVSPRGENETEENRAWETHYSFNTSGLAQLDSKLAAHDNYGHTFLNYTELMPVLVAAIQELSDMVTALQSANSYSMAGTDGVDASLLPAARDNGCRLDQNAPNPFGENTVIRYSVPEGSGDAWIFIFDMQGKLMRQLPLNARDDRVILHANDLAPGMYLYSLVVNGREMDTKRMIISK